jgi:multiple antibiotic resistance protein
MQDVQALTSYAALAFGSLFAVLNPVAVIPPFLAMTESNSPHDRAVMARRACLIALCVLAIFALAGMSVLEVFGVSLPGFQIAGGLVLVRVAFELLQGERGSRVSPEERLEGAAKDDISVTPLAVPILCGPASIATALLVSSKAQAWAEKATLVGVMALIYAGIYLLLLMAGTHSHRLGPTAIRISSRIMGLILAAVAVEFVLGGIKATFHFG